VHVQALVSIQQRFSVMTIRAAVMTAPEEPIELWDLEEPSLDPGGILIETVASEVCGTDVHLYHGRLSGVPYPIIPGHVSVGRVLELCEVAADALGYPLAVGDLVTFYDVHEVCNTCYYCTVSKQPNRCPSRRVYGITYGAAEGPLGGWAERIYLKPGVRVVKLREPLSAEDVIGGGCGLFTGFGAVERSALLMGDTVVVQGSGPVGLSAAAFATLKGAGRVIVIGAPAARLELALAMGADEVLSVETTSPEHRTEAVRERTGGRGADVVIEASGNPQAVPEGLALVRDGGTYVIAGHYTDVGPVAINPHTDINRAHVDIRGQWGTDFAHVVRGLTMLAKYRERFQFARIIGGRYGLERAGQALADVEALKVTKAIIDPQADR
jgi:threonine dehydrogenase-like Zn-dependent dehydrogenase